MLDVRTREGAPWEWPALWQRHNLLVLFGHDPSCPSCSRVIADLHDRRDELKFENTVPVAIFAEDPGQAVPPEFLVLLDAGSRLAAALGVEPGTLVSTDRFFEILEEENAHSLGADEAAFDSIDWVKLAERRCPECGVGTW